MSYRAGDAQAASASGRKLILLEPLLIVKINRLIAVKHPRSGFAGGYIVGATPVPIPNTAVKPDKPMILPQRESRSPPAFYTEPRS
jgi:hypothetical protein